MLTTLNSCTPKRDGNTRIENELKVVSIETCRQAFINLSVVCHLGCVIGWSNTMSCNFLSTLGTQSDKSENNLIVLFVGLWDFGIYLFFLVFTKVFYSWTFSAGLRTCLSWLCVGNIGPSFVSDTMHNGLQYGKQILAWYPLCQTGHIELETF